MQLYDTIGAIAAVLTTLSFIPQVWQTWRTRDVSGISLGMYLLFTVGVALWFTYGILVDAWPIIVANFMTLSMALAMLAMKLSFSPRRLMRRRRFGR